MAWSCLPDGSVEFLNRQWLDYTGLSLDTALGLAWKTVIHPDDLEALTDHWQVLLACGQAGAAEARLRRYGGEYRWFLLQAKPAWNRQGDIVRWYGTNIDIEERKRAEVLLAAEKTNLGNDRGWCSAHEHSGMPVRHHR
jgi:PAS domain S-box-containing protein